ncbi:hypothetical protein [Vibrio cholerae]|uniref:hypothetical protein n=1 Tax=Vibrio cholerae TaxID=666 RepID=UPI001C6100A5|nr:hypothetical protein [Vibrio cholerae]
MKNSEKKSKNTCQCEADLYNAPSLTRQTQQALAVIQFGVLDGEIANENKLKKVFDTTVYLAKMAASSEADRQEERSLTI